MRRKDREVTETAAIDEIIRRCHCCRLGFLDNDEVYIVPLNFGFTVREGVRILYFHSAKQGRKIDLIRTGTKVGFEMDTGYVIREADVACDYSADFQSVIGWGRASILDDAEEKETALREIMRHNTSRQDCTFAQGMVHSVCVFQLRVEALSCKEHK